jgi:hypothetical protein
VDYNNRKYQWTRIPGREERKSIYKKPHIDLHNILQRRQGERNCQGELPFSIDVKGGERKIKSMKIGGEMVTGGV